MASDDKKIFFSTLLAVFIIEIFFVLVLIFPILYAGINNINYLSIALILAVFFSSLVTTIFFIYYFWGADNSKISAKKYNRLESLNHPLLFKLSTEAPGSYHHSVNVANLSHRAAKAVGANSSLVRLAGYYHDTGKIIHPEIFIENQGYKKIEIRNKRQILRAAKIITAHPKVGKKIAEEYNLPEEIIQIIAEHHGTTVAKFLYNHAKDFGKIKISDFRYGGPKPQSIESVIVMLSDCVEAATKASRELDKKKITKIVDNIISEKIEEKQFVNVSIKPVEFQRIRNSLIETLFSMYHQRILSEKKQNDRN